jgi:hypothetical protein
MIQPQNPDSPTVLLRRLHHWRMAFFGLMILMAGLTIGAAATCLVLHRTGPEGPPSDDRARQMMVDLMPRLQLSPQQTQQVGPLMRRHMQRLEEIREQGRTQILQELEAMDGAMATILRPEQQQRWRDLTRSLPGPFRGPGWHGPGPKGPFGPRGGPQMRFRKSVQGPVSSPNDPAPPN